MSLRLARSVGHGIGRDGGIVIECVKWDDGTYTLRREETGMSTQTDIEFEVTEETTESRRLNALAAILCADAQEFKYDHGPHPTLVSFTPAYCPRHLGMAADVLAGLRSDGAARQRDRQPLT